MSFGRTYIAIPGPTVVLDSGLGAMHRSSPNIYEGELHEVYPGILSDLRAIVGRKASHLASTSRTAMERGNLSTQTCSRGKKALVAVTGHFGRGWATELPALGVDVIQLDFSPGRSVDLGQVLDRDTTHEIQAVLVTHGYSYECSK